MSHKSCEGRVGFTALICLFSLGAMVCAFGAEQKVNIEKTSYGGWDNCYRMSNGKVELVATSDVGPRIIRFGFVGEENEFSESKSDLGKVGGDQWRGYGGHRLWVAPEASPRSYYPDNAKVEAKVDGNTLTLTAPPELDPSFKVNTGVQKEMQVIMHPDGHVTVVHRVTNVNLWPVELAPWALSVMAPNGRAIIPAPDPTPHPQALLPVRPMAVWSYTNLADPRLIWGKRYIVVRQDPSLGEPLKLGVGNERGWVGYARSGHVFLKLYDYVEGARYPDFGSNTETWTNSQILEVETLGPLTTLPPKGKVEHVENWFLFEGVEVTDDESSIDANMLPKVKEAQHSVR
ncbi:MAG: hypothetical protein Q8Q12_15935 [bacterium]|nr:hypothetical protein [bacterium]